MTRYCPDCGDPHECAVQAERDDAKTRIRLAEIEAQRDIRVAELAAANRDVEAAAAVDIATAEMEAETAHAEGRADGMETVLEDLGGGGGEPASEPAPAVELVDPPDDGPEVEAAPPPPDAEHEHAAKRGGGFWGTNYG
jgi:hypothetical protein